MPRPAFRADVDAEHCELEVRVNDAPVSRSKGRLPTSEMSPATPWLAQGANSFALRVKPLEDEAHARASLTVHEAGTPDANRLVLTTLAYAPLAAPRDAGSSPPGAGPGGVRAGPVELLASPGGATVRRTVEIAAPIPRWRWLDSEPMTDTPALRDAIYAQYQAIWTLLSEKRTEALPALLAERTREYRLALFAPDADIPPDYGLGALVARAQPFELDRDDLEFELYGDGRLAEYRRWDDTPAICFRDNGLGRYFRFVFRKEGAGFVVAR